LFFGLNTAEAQIKTGNFVVNGLFLAPPPLEGYFSLTKTITKTGDNTYLANFANIGGNGYQFTFSIDASGHLINWKPVGNTPASSGFMTRDNPGNIDFTFPFDTATFNSTKYNNTYDASTQTFYMHYGYHGGGAATDDQSTYTRQVYEKWEYDTVRIISITPAWGTQGSIVILKGRRFTGATNVSFGGTAAASFKVMSDTVISAKLGNGASGRVKVVTPNGSAVRGGFVYCSALVTPSINITAAPGTIICAHTVVKFTAEIHEPGDSGVIVWKKNGRSVGTNSFVYIDSTLRNEDSVWAVFKRHSPCTTTTIVYSNKLKFIVHNIIDPFVAIKSNAGAIICKNTVVTFTATKTANGDSVTYVWKKNNKKVGTDNATYTDSLLKNGDSVWVWLISHTPCVLMDTVKSNVIKFTVNPIVKPAVFVTTNISGAICAGTKIRFVADTLNTGTNPLYQWRKNGIAVGTNAKAYVDSLLQTGDGITCTVTSHAACRLPDTAISSPVVFFVQDGAPAAPLAIHGNQVVNKGDTGLLYNVAYVAHTTFVWTVPAGAVIVSGQNTNAIHVSWGTVGGLITVRAVNACGKSPVVSKTVSVKTGLISFAGEESSSNAGLFKANLFPNPATGFANLQLSGYKGKVVVTLTNLAGKVLWKEEMANVETYRLPLGRFATGMYIVTIKNDAGTRLLKLIKAK
jgi:hypothetical protein